MMNTVWIILSGEYWDRGFIGAYSSQEIAEDARIAHGSDAHKPFECKLDSMPKGCERGESPWSVDIDHNGMIVHAGPNSGWPNLYALNINMDENGVCQMRMEMYARDLDHASEIANDRRLYLLASDEWTMRTCLSLDDIAKRADDEVAP